MAIDFMSNLLKGAQSTVTAGIKTVQGLPGAIQAQTMTALSTAQRAVSQAVAQLPQPQSPAKSPSRTQTTTMTATPKSTTQTQTSTRAPSSFEVASRAASRVTQPDRAQQVATTIQQGAQQFAQAHAPILEGIQRDIGRAAGALATGIDFANRRKAEAQAELTRRAGPAPAFEQGLTYPLYQKGQEFNVGYQQFVIDTEPIWSLTNPLRLLPEARKLQAGFVRAPGQFLEGATWLAPAAERGGQLLWKEPHKLPETVSRFAGEQVEGLKEGFGRDPWGTAGELIGTAAIGFGLGGAARGPLRTPKKTPKTGKPPSGGSPAPAASPARRGAGHRFRGLEFGYQVKQVPKPQKVEGKPFNLADWHAERAKYAKPQTTQQTPKPTTTVPTHRSGGRIAAVSAGVVMGSRAPDPYAGTSLDFSPEPTSPEPTVRDHHTTQDQRVVQPTVQDQQTTMVRPQEQQSALITVQGQRTVQPTTTQPTVTIQDDDRPWILMPYLPTVQGQQTSRQTTQRAPPPRPRPGGVPLLLPPAQPRTPPRRRRRRRDEEEWLRRLRGEQRDHWELGPAPGLAEMGVMIFGAGRRSALDLLPRGTSVLNLGGSPTPGGQPSFGFAARAPARPPVIPSFGPPSRGITGGSRTPGKTPAKKPAHAGKTPAKKRGKATKKKK
jgi:hypothetical protein